MRIERTINGLRVQHAYYTTQEHATDLIVEAHKDVSLSAELIISQLHPLQKGKIPPKEVSSVWH